MRIYEFSSFFCSFKEFLIRGHSNRDYLDKQAGKGGGGKEKEKKLYDTKESILTKARDKTRIAMISYLISNIAYDSRKYV